MSVRRSDLSPLARGAIARRARARGLGPLALAACALAGLPGVLGCDAVLGFTPLEPLEPLGGGAAGGGLGGAGGVGAAGGAGGVGAQGGAGGVGAQGGVGGLGAGGLGGMGGGGGAEPGVDAPVLLFTDLTSGPATGGLDDHGAFVTVYGRRLHGAQGQPATFTLGGQPLEVLELPPAAGTNATVGLDRFVFQPGSAGALIDAEYDLVATVDGVSTAPIPFRVRPGAIKFVSPSAVGGTGTLGDPFDLETATQGLSAGDVLVLRGGDYPTDVPCTGAGSHCTLYVDDVTTSPNLPLTIVGYPGEEPVLGPPVQSADTGNYKGLHITQVAHVTLANFAIADTGTAGTVQGATARVVGLDVYDVDSIGLSFNLSSELWLYGSRLSPVSYAISTGGVPKVDIGWNVLSDGASGVRVPLSDVDLYYVHDNRMVELITGVVLTACSFPPCGSLGNGGGVLVINNQLIDCGWAFELPSDDSLTSVYVAYNSSYQEAQSYGGIKRELYASGANLPTTESITFWNNVFHQSAASDGGYLATHDAGVMQAVSAAELGFVGHHNLWKGQAADLPWVDPTDVVVASVGFDDPPFDMCLAAGSPAIDVGVALADELGLPFEPRDFLSRPRPLGAGVDMGACERPPP